MCTRRKAGFFAPPRQPSNSLKRDNTMTTKSTGITIKFDETITKPLLHPVDETPLETTDGKPMTFTMAGRTSKQYRSAKNSHLNRSMRKGGKKESAKDVQQANDDFVCKCFVGFNNCDINGIDFQEAGVNAIITDPQFYWVNEQLNEPLVDNADFLSKGSESQKAD